MQETLRKLEQVQEIDLQINSILRKKAEFPQRLAGYDDQIKSITAKADEKRKIVDELDKSRKQQVGALELNEDRAKRSQEKLEQIKTNQEFQALQKEIESLKKNSAVIQENAKKVSDELEKHKAELGTFDTQLTELRTKRESEAAAIAEEEKRLNVEQARLEETRKGAIVGIDRRYMVVYDRIRQGKTGMGIALAINGNCKGCNMRIPPQIYIEIQRGTDMHTCPSCKRILIFRTENKTDSQENTRSA